MSVFEADDGRGGTIVIKQASPADGLADPLGLRRFRREIELATMTSHPGLARVHDHGDDWIGFERLDAGAQGQPARPASVRPLLAGLAGVLAYLHARGIVHRDVKPAHVMDRAGQPVLIDLGVAGLMGEDPLEGTELVGSPAWMAPEQILGARPAPPADIWSLCAVGASMLRAAPLFSGSADAVLALRRRGRSPALDLADRRADDPRLLALIEAGLGPPEARPTAAEIVAALGPDPFDSGAPASTPHPTTPSQARARPPSPARGEGRSQAFRRLCNHQR